MNFGSIVLAFDKAVVILGNERKSGLILHHRLKT
jgi:sRNA-binding regulator protein Hfq